MAMSA